MRNRVFLFTTLLLLLIAACTLPGQQSASPDPKTVETSVAATLTSAALGQEPSQTPPTDTTQADETPQPPAQATEPSAVEADLVLVYTHQGNPWVLVDDQAPRQLSQAGDTIDVLISDDAQRIVFLRQELDQHPPEPVEIRSVKFDGSDEQVLLSPADFDGLYPLEDFSHYTVSSIDFIPGTHQLLLNTRGLFEGPGLVKNNDLLQLDSDTGQLTKLLPRGQGGDFHPSPDGDRLVLVQPDNVSMADIDGSNLQQDILTFDPIITYSEFQYYPRPIWSADGQQAVISIPNPDILADDLYGTLWRLPRDGSTAEELTQIDGMVYFPSESGGSIVSPDFERAIAMRGGGQDPRRLIIIELDSGSEQTYTTGSIDWRGWAPDSQHFLFSQGDPSQIQLGALGQSPSALVNGMDFSWLNSSEFLFLSGSQTNWKVRRGNLSGLFEDLVVSDSRFTAYDFAQP